MRVTEALRRLRSYGVLSDPADADDPADWECPDCPPGQCPYDSGDYTDG